ncbi:uncharacterized protein LOC124497457 [Dermatophagoides farinae]|uniref:uncharacterized protein LOC124497457 n=1 Tax=Dermatophagoides farinae TaxID=6954 RepID=UPI003F63BEF4
MELKVWCDGIQRIVCGATESTTCQDVVFALAHATGQTGRFILIEKWKNNERVLAPSDHPILSLSKWGEYSNDVIFVLKKSGDLSSNTSTSTTNNQNRQATPKLSKKSESDLLQKRKRSLNMENIDNHHQQMTKSMSTLNNQMRNQSPQQLFQNVINNNNKNQESSISSHQNIEYLSLTRDVRNTIHHHQRRPSYHHNQMVVESLYGTLGRTKNRPKQPPPYQEAIAKSSLMNGIMFQQQQNGHHSDANTCTTNESLNSSHQMKQQQQSLPISLVSIHNRKIHQNPSEQNRFDENMDQQQLDEVDLVKQKWMEQELIIQRLESEQQLEQELEQVIRDGHNYQAEMREIKMKLADCENEVGRRRDEIYKLMSKIDNKFNTRQNSDEFDSTTENQQHSTMIERLKICIQEKEDKIHNQETDLQVMNDSLEHFDQTLLTKNQIVNELIERIKEANVEGLELQQNVTTTTAANLPPSATVSQIDGDTIADEQQQQRILMAGFINDKRHDNNQTIKLSSSSMTTNRKIPVSLHELGNTVPTKRNPDGIWV